MSDPRASTVTYHGGGSQRPPARPTPGPLPSPDDDIVLIRPLEGSGRFWEARWRDLSKNTRLVAEFRKSLPGSAPSSPATGPRTFRDLGSSAFGDEFRAAIITELPARLPAPFDDYELIDF